MMDVNLDLYDDLTEMIACDMRTDFDTADLTPLSAADLGECLSDPSMDHSIAINSISSSLAGTNTPPNSAGDSYHLETESSIAWFQNNPQLFAVNNSDFEQTGGGLMVNPQTGIPISRSVQGMSSPTRSLSSGNITTTSSVFMSTPPPEGMTNVLHVAPTNVNQDQSVNIHVSEVTPNHARPIIGRPKTNSQRKHGKEHIVIDPQEKIYPKPTYSYSCLIAMALKNSKTGSLPVSEIYSFMTENFPYFKTAPNGWKNSVRHNLSLNKCFEKIEKPGTGAQRKGCLWAMNPAKIEKMDEEVQKWKRKDPTAIRQSMAKPEILERLERGEVKSSSPTVEEMTVDSTTEGGLSPDSTPGEDLEYSSVKSEEHIPPLPDLVIQNGFWEELNNPNAIPSQGIAVKSKVSTSQQQMDQILNRSSSLRPPSASSPHHSIVSSSTSDLQGNYSYSGMTLDNSHQVVKQEADTWSSSQENAKISSVNKTTKHSDETSNGNALDAQNTTVFHQNGNRTLPSLI